jgi:hypothetical protein
VAPSLTWDAARPSVQHFPKAPPQDRDTIEMVAACVESFEGGMGPQFRELCNKWFRQYRQFSRFTAQYNATAEPDRDTPINEMRNVWGAQLHIPLSFRTIETMVPRAIANAPHLLYLPRQQQWEDNVDTVRLLIDSQQEQIDIDLAFQAVMRAGHIYGIGFGKAFWRKEWANRSRMAPSLRDPNVHVLRKGREVVFDDPDYEDVDPYDMMWDPMGSAFRGSGRCGWVVHRQWLSLAACLQRLETGAWNTASARALAADPRCEDILRAMGNGQKYDEVWQERMDASGLGSQRRGEQPHEVWEWHDGERVITVLDRQVLVQDAESPCCGMLPFQAYRPTPLQKQMVGIGDMEPLEHLNAELDTLRSQRTNFRTIALNAGYAYDDAAIDADDIVFGPGALIPVRNAGNISNVLQPLQVREMPGSATQDEQAIRGDMDAVVGLTDQTDAGASAINTTATGAQLNQAALGMRILLKSRRFEVEVVRNVARSFLRMDQRMITTYRDPIRQPEPGYDVAQASKEGRWRWFPVGPGELQGEFEIIPEGGSMAAKNIPQDRQDAMQMMNLFGNNPHVDPKRVLLEALKLFGLDRTKAQAWLTRPETPVPPEALKLLEDAGVNGDLIRWAVSKAQRDDPQLADQPQEGAQNVA